MSISRTEWSLGELKLLQTAPGRRELLRSGRSLAGIQAACFTHKISNRDNKIMNGKHYSFSAYARLVKEKRVDIHMLKSIPTIKGKIGYALEQILDVTLVNDADLKAALKGIKVVHFTYMLDLVNDTLHKSVDQLPYLYHNREVLLNYNAPQEEEDAKQPTEVEQKTKVYTINLFNLQLQVGVNIENSHTLSVESFTIKLREDVG
jgi:hypothetical protein